MLPRTFTLTYKPVKGNLYFSVSMLPDNPYLRPETVGGGGRARMASVNGAEEVYYSDDSDDESGPFSNQSKALQM